MPAAERRAASSSPFSAPARGRPATGSPRPCRSSRDPTLRPSSPRPSRRCGPRSRERAAAAVLESRLGGGSRRSRHFPGNVRNVSDYPADERRRAAGGLRSCAGRGCRRGAARRVARRARAAGRSTRRTPRSADAPAPLFVPHLRGTWRTRTPAARRRGAVEAAASAARPRSRSSLPLWRARVSVSRRGRHGRGPSGIWLVAAYARSCAVGGFSRGAAVSLAHASGSLAVPALIATQAVYVAGFVREVSPR